MPPPRPLRAWLVSRRQADGRESRRLSLSALKRPGSSSHKRTNSGEVGGIVAAPAAVTTPGVVIAYPNCPCSATSIRQQANSAELVSAWEAEMRFSAEQSAKMADFRAALLEEGILHEVYDNRPSFFRFLQARQWDIGKASAMYRSHMDWRKKNELDEWLPSEDGPVPRLLHDFSFPEMHSVKAAYAFTHHKVGRDGRPVYFDRLGSIDYKAMIKNSTHERVMKYFVWYCEASQHYRFPAASLACGKHVCKGLYVMDLKSFGLSKLNAETRAFVKAFTSTASDNYPESIFKTYIINAPFVFRSAWGIVSGWLDANTVAKFSILGGEKEYMPKLLEVVRTPPYHSAPHLSRLAPPHVHVCRCAQLDHSDIPSFLGGGDESCDFIDEQGCWAAHMPTTKGPYLEARE